MEVKGRLEEGTTNDKLAIYENRPNANTQIVAENRHYVNLLSYLLVPTLRRPTAIYQGHSVDCRVVQTFKTLPNLHQSQKSAASYYS
jgi:hypothetical protein